MLVMGGGPQTLDTVERTIELARFWRDRGMLFLGCSSDVGMLYERAKAIAGELAAPQKVSAM